MLVLTAESDAGVHKTAGDRGPIHSTPIDKVLADLGAMRDGLSDGDAAARLIRTGPNTVPSHPGPSVFAILIDQFRGLVVILLVAAAVIAAALGEIVDTLAIAAVLAINASLGFAMEWRARRAMASLRQLEARRAIVTRGGRRLDVDPVSLVPGDIIDLYAGSQVPADARLIDATDFSTTEAALTGESLPVSKQADIVLGVRTAIADRVNMVYMGTTIATGAGVAVVTATGRATELGHIGALVGSIEEEQTPLERRLDALGNRLAWITLGVSMLVGLLGIWRGITLDVVLETSIALAVAAMPEALPAVATIALAFGMRRMATRHALVRRLPAVETLGSTTVVCADKTRTLTSGEMAVVRIWADGRIHDVAERGTDILPDAAAIAVLETAALASRQPAGHSPSAGSAVGDPVDMAIATALDRLHGGKGGVAPAPHFVLPFSNTRKFMATFFETGDGLRAVVKGAPERVIGLSDRIGSADGPAPLDPARVSELRDVNARLARSGLRVLGVASGPVAFAAETALSDLTFEGFICLADPPADGVRETVAALRDAGLRTVMITGDQRGTAEAVARWVGLLDPGAATIDGAELDALPPEQREDRIARTAIFSRVSPEHKLTIVSVLQARGEIVAMLGDGVNDAAALKKADVGVAMGTRGTDAAREAAAIVLQDDRFETIAAAVEEGRVMFDNIRKFVFYLFSCNIAEILVLLAAGAAGLPLPLLPLQLLWLNIVTDSFPSLALAVEPGDRSVMQRPPRSPDEAILSKSFMLAIVTAGIAITASTLVAFLWGLRHSPEAATTIAFMTLAFAQIGHLGNARSHRAVVAPSRVFANRSAVLAVIVAVALQLATTIDPIAALLDVRPLGLTDWAVIAGCAAVPAVGGQMVKVLRAGC